MTREEAIRELNTFKIGAKSELGETALDMAIKALEQEPKLQNRCFTLTQGLMCLFCPYTCEHKAESEDKE